MSSVSVIPKAFEEVCMVLMEYLYPWLLAGHTQLFAVNRACWMCWRRFLRCVLDTERYSPARLRNPLVDDRPLVQKQIQMKGYRQRETHAETSSQSQSQSQVLLENESQTETISCDYDDYDDDNENDEGYVNTTDLELQDYDLLMKHHITFIRHYCHNFMTQTVVGGLKATAVSVIPLRQRIVFGRFIIHSFFQERNARGSMESRLASVFPAILSDMWEILFTQFPPPLAIIVPGKYLMNRLVIQFVVNVYGNFRDIVRGILLIFEEVLRFLPVYAIRETFINKFILRYVQGFEINDVLKQYLEQHRFESNEVLIGYLATYKSFYQNDCHLVKLIENIQHEQNKIRNNLNANSVGKMIPDVMLVSGGKIFMLAATHPLVQHSPWINSMLTMTCGDSRTSLIVLISNVSTSNKIYKFIEAYLADPMTPLKKPLAGPIMELVQPQYVDLVLSCSPRECTKLFQFSNSVGLDPLKDLIGARIATLIRGFSVEQIRSNLGILTENYQDADFQDMETSDWVNDA